MNSLLSFLGFILLLGPACRGGTPSSTPQPAQANAQEPGRVDLQRVVRKSRFIFQGTVMRARTSNVRTVAPSESTSVVRVDRVIYRPATLDDFTGKDITLVSRSRATAGMSSVFVTEIVRFGRTIAVAEVGRLAVPQDTAALQRSIQQALRVEADSALRDRIDSATLVIVGRVDSVRPAPPEIRGVPASEHWPDWWEAFVRSDSVLKGNAAATVLVLFSNSTDVVWSDAPKFRGGQEGVWILRRERGLGPEVGRYLSALHPLDYQTRDQSPRIRGLIQAR